MSLILLFFPLTVFFLTSNISKIIFKNSVVWKFYKHSFVFAVNLLSSHSCMQDNVFISVHLCLCVFVVYHMQEDGWIKVCKEDVSELIHRYRKGMFWVLLQYQQTIIIIIQWCVFNMIIGYWTLHYVKEHLNALALQAYAV